MFAFAAQNLLDASACLKRDQEAVYKHKNEQEGDASDYRYDERIHQSPRRYGLTIFMRRRSGLTEARRASGAQH